MYELLIIRSDRLNMYITRYRMRKALGKLSEKRELYKKERQRKRGCRLGGIFTGLYEEEVI